LNFIAAELHKMYSPWLFHPEYGAQAQDVARGKIAERLDYVEEHLGGHGPHLLGERFTVADAYLFTIVGWSGFAGVDLTRFPALRAFMDRVGARPKVKEAIAAGDRVGLKTTCVTPQRSRRSTKMSPPWLRRRLTHPFNETDFPMSAGRS
jgi:glutathione S-transferase